MSFLENGQERETLGKIGRACFMYIFLGVSLFANLLQIFFKSSEKCLQNFCQTSSPRLHVPRTVACFAFWGSLLQNRQASSRFHKFLPGEFADVLEI